MFTVNIYTESCHSMTTYENEAEARDAFQNVVWTLSVAGREDCYAAIKDGYEGKTLADSRDLTGGTNQQAEDTYEAYVESYDVEAAERRIGA